MIKPLGCIGVFLALTVFLAVNGAPNPCENLDGRICNETQYEKYRQCIEESKTVRQKRQSLCEQLAKLQEEPTTVELAQADEGVVVRPTLQVIPALESIKTVDPVEANDIPELDPTSIELKSLNRKVVIVQGDDDDNEEFEYHVPTNVTTVIRLTNVVNNTNIVNVPTHVNTTNVNNIHIYSNITGGEDPSASEEVQDKCCTAVRPKTCYASTQGFKCQHKKFKTCGPQCTSKIVHVQRRKRCDRNGNCKEKLAYVPQPEKPKCVYIDQWPFIACGKPANMDVICDGCYDHYGYGHEAFNGQVAPQCRGCYDNAIDQGPLYRRGPVLQPYYYHEPPCYITGSCPPAYGDCGYGCFGHQMIDPAWGPQPSPYDPTFDPTNTGYYDEEDLQPTNGTDSDWGVPVHKCTVVSDDNTISVQNCTSGVDNQYAAAPSNYPYYNPVQYPQKSPYKVKQTAHRQQQQIRPEVDDGSGFGADSSVAFVIDDEEDYDFDL